MKELELDVSDAERTAIGAISGDAEYAYTEPTLEEIYNNTVANLQTPKPPVTPAIEQKIESLGNGDFSNYLNKKQLTELSGNAFVGLNGNVYVPMYSLLPNTEHKPQQLQTISATSKSFEKNRSVKELCHPIPNRDACYSSKTVLICEGLATGEILHQATNLPVICTLNNCNQLPSVISLLLSGTAEKVLISIFRVQTTDFSRSALAPSCSF